MQLIEKRLLDCAATEHRDLSAVSKRFSFLVLSANQAGGGEGFESDYFKWSYEAASYRPGSAGLHVWGVGAMLTIPVAGKEIEKRLPNDSGP